MSRILPPHPNLEHLKKEAKALLKGQQRGDCRVCPTLRLLRRFSKSDDEAILSADLALHEAQYALAMDYGWKSWRELQKQVLSLQEDSNCESDARPGAFVLDGVPAGRANTLRFAQACQMSLEYCGGDCDYTTIMGDSGLAFILQADSKHTPWGKPVDQLDIGWWPLDMWGALLRLDFVGKVAGVELRALQCVTEYEYNADAAATYRQYFQTPVLESLQAGRPPIAVVVDVWVVTGYDDGDPPLLGQKSCSDIRQRKRMDKYPWRVIIPGQSIQPMNRAKADFAALEFAVALGRDELPADVPAQMSSGQKSFTLWTSLLRDPQRWGAHFYHANVVGHLRLNRQSAGAYLRTMAERHSQTVASHLLAAAAIYDDVITELNKADISKEVMASVNGRETLAKQVEQIAKLEVKAVKHLEITLKILKQ